MTQPYYFPSQQKPEVALVVSRLRYTNQSARFSSQVRRTVVTRVHEAVKALALCHNVTPVTEEFDPCDENRKRVDSVTSDDSDVDGREDSTVTYQASSPDEVQSSPYNTDTEWIMDSIRINGVSVLTGCRIRIRRVELTKNVWTFPKDKENCLL